MGHKYLSDNDTLVISKPLAKALGVAASIILRRVQHWLDFYEKHDEQQKIKHNHDGNWWVFNGYQGWADDIEIYSKSSIKRIIGDLENLGLLVTQTKYNQRKNDRTKWYTINYDAYDRFIALWERHGKPQYQDGKRTPEYQSFMDQWTTVGIPTVVPPMDHSSPTQETTVVPPMDHSSPSVTRVNPEVTTDRTQSEENVVQFPGHMIAFETQNNRRTHAWVKAYSQLLKQPYSASKQEMALLLELAQTYDLDTFQWAAAEKLKTKPGAKLFWILQDMPNLIAARAEAKPQNGYHTMSPAVPQSADHEKATPEQLAAALAEAKAIREGDKSA